MDTKPLMRYSIEPYQHQLTAINRCVDRDAYGLFFEQGTGKTFTAISIVRLKWRQHRAPLRTLVICPSIVVYNWEREFQAFSPEAVHSHVQVLTGVKKKRIKQYETPGKSIFITNTEAVNTAFWKEYIAKGKWDIIVLDESHRFKTHNAKRTKELIRFAEDVRYVFALSGTPILNSMADIWSQLALLKVAVHPNFYAWRKQFFMDKNAGMPSHKYFPNWQPKRDRIKELRSLIETNSMRVTKDEVLDLPPLVRQIVEVPLMKEQRNYYLTMEQGFLALLENEGEAVVAETALTRLLRLMQICSGILATDSGETRRIESGKKAALKELLTDIAPYHKVIVWANFIACYDDVEEICNDLKLPFATIRGLQKLDERQAQVDAFQHDDRIRVMIANQSAGGTGVNLTAASYMIYYAKNFNLGDDLQSEARAHRGGSERHSSITRIDIITRNTIEQEVTSALHSKKELSDLLLDIRRRGNVG